MIAILLAAATLAAPALAQEDTGGRFPNGRPMLAEGRYAEWPGDGSNPCTTGTPRSFRLVPGDAAIPGDMGRIVIDLGSGPAEFALISAELQDTPIQVWDLAGLATIDAADAAGTRLTALMYFRNDGRTDLVDARTTSPESQGEVMVRMQQNPEPHGVLADGTTLNPFVWCGRE
ncbi:MULTISPECIES: hypothetical protein [Hyphobacterium]|uniref:Uncharacterized protein n=1 Tax=Hyphobacterium vulgare TaxID=1736751 RepID=A0ABV6ZYT6_9PROT